MSLQLSDAVYMLNWYPACEIVLPLQLVRGKEILSESITIQTVPGVLKRHLLKKHAVVKTQPMNVTFGIFRLPFLYLLLV